MDLIKQIETEKRYHPIGSPKAPVELLPNGIEVPSTIAHESETESLDEYAFSLRSAEATVFARDLANTRGSEATPEWMET